MAARSVNRVLRHLRPTALGRDEPEPTDGDLLEQYVTRHDEMAFEALVRRHGPMVLGVCRRILRNQADAEDAFQATFLVLVRKAASIRSRATVGNWLYGVAHNTALKAKAMNRKRRSREQEAGTRPQPPAAEEIWSEVQALLDTELSLLPDRYRIPIVLCDLEGRTIKEAARHLGWPQGTTATRLARGRALLARRLTKHGLTLPAGVLAAALAEGTATACVAPALLRATLAAAAGGTNSTRVTILTEGVLQSMFLKKLKGTLGVVLVVAALALGAGILTRATRAADGSNAGPRSAEMKQDESNVKETVLALEKRLWDTLKTQDRAAFQSLTADDFVGLAAGGRYYDGAEELQWIANWCVTEYEMKNIRVVLLSKTSALVMYDVHYKVRPTGKQEIADDTHRHAVRAWALRHGQWRHVYYEDRILNQTPARWQAPWEIDSNLGIYWTTPELMELKPPRKPE